MGVTPGQYIVRVAVQDSTGRVGSVEHRVDARRVPVGPLSGTGPVLVRVPSRATAEPRLALDSVRQDERLALEISLDGDSTQVSGADVVFEIAKSEDSPALVNAPGALSRDPQGSILAHGVADMRVLPPGEYIARAKLRAGERDDWGVAAAIHRDRRSRVRRRNHDHGGNDRRAPRRSAAVVRTFGRRGAALRARSHARAAGP